MLCKKDSRLAPICVFGISESHLRLSGDGERGTAQPSKTAGIYLKDAQRADLRGKAKEGDPMRKETLKLLYAKMKKPNLGKEQAEPKACQTLLLDWIIVF